MASHPEIQLVSRDRAGDYASAAASGAPQATQCADRFHLLQNLGEALEGVLARHLAAHRTHLAQESRGTPQRTISNARALRFKGWIRITKSGPDSLVTLFTSSRLWYKIDK